MTPACLQGVGARQHGLSMAELLVAIALGCFVTLAAGSLFIVASRSYLAQTQSADAEEGGRYALGTIARALRQSAHVDWQHADVNAALAGTGPARLAGLDAHSVPKNVQGIDNALPTSVNGSDVLAVRFEGAGAPPNGDGSVVDCAGFPIHDHQEGWSIFYVDRNPEGETELRCKYKGAGGWGADAVIAGVDSFQVLYGVDTDEPADGVPNRYVSATMLNAMDGALVPAGASPAERSMDLNRRTFWKRVVSVQYALLLRGARAADTDAGARVYDLFGPVYANAFGALDPGTRLREDVLARGSAPRERRVYSATVMLRGGAR